jgi:Holliday junction resolvasome RuvABC endonuclease subunit
MKVLGLDLSLTSTGFSHGGGTGIISSNAKGAERLYELKKHLEDLLRQFKPEIVAIEGYSFGSRNSQAHSIGEWGGVVRVTLWELAYGFIEIPPTCRAKFATGRGNASKSEVMSSISARTGIIWSGKGCEDRCDAWILEEMTLAKYGESKFEWPDLNLSALDKVDWSPYIVGNSRSE